MEEKNYYDWLEVSPKASAEVIEKAYKALVLKYHPDVYKGDFREAEEIIKKVNEAYEVLSDNTKRVEYDGLLKAKEQQQNQQQQSYNTSNTQTTSQTQQYNQQTSQQQVNQQININQQQDNLLQKEQELKAKYEQEIETAKRKAYYDAYIKELKNRGFKIRYKKDFKYYLKLSIIIIVLLAICFIIWHIPFTKNWIINSINNNEYSKLFFGWILRLN